MSIRDGSYLSEREARELSERVLSHSRADEARVNITSAGEGNTRFARNQVTTSGEGADATLSVQSAFAGRVGSATTNRFDEEALRRVVESSERLARLTPADPEYLSPLGPQEYPRGPDPWFEETASLDSGARVEAVRRVMAPALERDLVSSGFLSVRARSRAVATSRGLFTYERSANASLVTTVRTPDGKGSGWAGASVHDWRGVDPGEIAGRAVRKAEESRNPQPIEPGRWTVILEPQAVGQIVGFIFNVLSARAADEGRSFFSRPGGGNRTGDLLLDERVTLLSDPGDPGLFSDPFDDEGLPNRRMIWFRNGRLENLVYDRYWAEREGVAPTGFPSGFLLEGGEGSLEEIIASTERGILITRFWYMRAVDQRAIRYTGLTRDGNFLVEDGRITRPVQNLRWNESPIHVLNHIDAIGAPQRALPGELGGMGPGIVVPPIRVRDFNLTSLSDAV